MIKLENKSSVSSEKLKKQVVQGIVFFAALVPVLVVFIIFSQSRMRDSHSKREVLEYWEQGLWKDAFIKSKDSLASAPMDAFFLTMNGFSAYQAAITRTNNVETFEYIDESIWSLRKVLLVKNADRDGKIRYTLGKAYYAKGQDYADLSIKYLEEAKAKGFTAGDLNEYLGLSYQLAKEYGKSIEVLSASLDPANDEGSDLLLYHIAQSYMGLEDWDQAKAYLTRCTEATRDADLELKARLLLGKVLRNSGGLEEAIKILNLVLDSGGENKVLAEAAFELGEIYDAMGDMIKARAMWRLSARSDNTFAPARDRLNTK
jgi:tetratricopeptide (TPR) repeat protein